MFLTHVDKWLSTQLDSVTCPHSPPPLLIISRYNLAITSLLFPVASIKDANGWG